MADTQRSLANAGRGSAGEVFAAALKLGLTSFGGPIAHLGYFRQEYVERRGWLDESTYSGLVALAQILPGPASSQVGFMVGLWRAGLAGALAAWAGFTLPSALALALFARYLPVERLAHMGWVHGLLIVAVAVVAQAVWSMATRLATGRIRASLALLVAVALVLWPSPAEQVGAMAAAALIGWRFLRPRSCETAAAAEFGASRLSPRVGMACGLAFFALLLLLPLAQVIWPARELALFSIFYRAGALVFGGGHVVLPLLAGSIVGPSWLSSTQFLTGYGAAQAVPGPLFTLSAYLGAAADGWLGAAIALAGIFLPGLLLVLAALPHWQRLQQVPALSGALAGINAAVVGILLAALYNPVWLQAMKAPGDVALGMAAFGLLSVWRCPPWLVVVFSALGGALAAQWA